VGEFSDYGLKVVVGFSFCFFLVGEMQLEIQEWKKERRRGGGGGGGGGGEGGLTQWGNAVWCQE
jgi:hypothetical protein